MTDAFRQGPAFCSQAAFAALDRVRTPRRARWVARLLLLAFVVFPFALVLVPWQQTVRGRGQVVAYSPTERKQVVTALVGGQVKKWHVVENTRVKAGDPMVDIDDNDPELADRLEKQREYLEGRLEAAKEEIEEQDRAVEAQRKAKDAAVDAARANETAARMMVDVARQTLENNKLNATWELRQYEAFDRMFKGELPPGLKLPPGAKLPINRDGIAGLIPELDRDRAKIQAERAATDVVRAEADWKRAEAARLTNESLVYQAEATGASNVATARSGLQRAEQNKFTIERELQQIYNQIQRFKARFVKAPCDGVVYRISDDAQIGQFVKEGAVLAEVVPDATDRVVELFVDGVDAPLIAAHMEQTGRGPHVRLQFEGWPAVQFTGWPSVAVGTFGGRVRQMDPTDDGKGRFRVLIEPEEMFEGDRWPEGLYLRQGNQAIGWVFLNRVTLGFELWRQFNGFPPVVAPKPPEKEKEGGKPPKVKPAG